MQIKDDFSTKNVRIAFGRNGQNRGRDAAKIGG